jgi:ribosomal protein L11 methyltransferase
MTTKKEEALRTWMAIEFVVSKEQEDLASWLMVHRGAKGCEVKPHEGDRVLLHSVFEKDMDLAEMDELKSSLEEYGLGSCLNSLKVSTLEEADWLSKWKQGFEQFPVGKRFMICPPWLKDRLSKDELANRHLILVEPGMAFGTGLHITTRFCLKSIEKHLQGPEVLDVGTGSGILAIAAAMINCECDVTAVDVDPVSIKVAQENLDLNGMSERVRLVLGSTEAVAGSVYQTLLSNLTCEDIIALLPDYEKLAPLGGVVICAGILKEKLPMLERALEGSSFEILEKELEDLWAGVILRKFR